MIYVFDLDDTLYDERQFVKSGLQALAVMAEQRWGLNPSNSYQQLITLLDTQGRGRMFDDWLAQSNLATRANIKRCISCYRLHKPNIGMPQAHHQLLQQLPKPLYLVTDGNKVVQHNKVQALGIAHYFKRVFITHRFGIQHAKPSTYCFEVIKKAEDCQWQDMAYIGDNPAKDFVNLNKLGVNTVRVLTGEYKDVMAKQGYNAKTTLMQLPELQDMK